MKTAKTRVTKKLQAKTTAMVSPLDLLACNDGAAETARKIISYYQGITDADPEDTLSDLLSDLMHFCDRNPRFGAFERELDRARTHYRDENQVF